MRSQLLRLEGDEVCAGDAKLARHAFLRGSLEAVEEMAGSGISESESLHYFHHLCNLQSAGNSPGPQVNVISGILREFSSHDDIGELQAASRFHDPEEFPEDGLLVRGEIDDTVGNYHIDAV